MATEDVRFLVRRKEEVAIYTSPSAPQKLLTIFAGECTKLEVSEDGELVCGIEKEAVIVFHLPSSTEKLTLELKEVLHVGFSKRGSYLVTCQRPNKQLKGEHKNVQIWELASGECLWSVHRQNVNDDSWPMLQWSADESSVFFSVVNTVHVYSPRDNFKSIMRKLPVKGINSFAVSPGRNLKLATYVPEAKGAPASIAIYPFSGFPKRHEDTPVIANRKSFYRVSGVHFLWNSTGTALLCSCFADVDVTNQSYYGEQQLHFLEAENEVSCVVPDLPKGPIHDVQWSPKGDQFAVVAGFMPAKTLLFDSKSNPIFDLGSGAFNFVRFNPFGRILCIAGFGNLPGDIVFYEKKPNGVCNKLNAIRSPSVSLEWSPCGKHILTAITAPRLRVDNRFKIFNYYGEDLATEEVPVLFEARWVPALEGTFKDQPISPRKTPSMLQTSKEEDSVYVPPHLRGKGGQRSSTVSFSLGHSEDSGGRIKKEPTPPSIPGSTFLSKSAAKNARRRAKKREQKESSGDQESSNPVEDHVVKQQEVDEHEDSNPSKDEIEKKIRGLKKKLKQIRQLKEKRSQGGQLEVEQLEKINTEKDIVEELEAYESRFANLM